MSKIKQFLNLHILTIIEFIYYFCYNAFTKEADKMDKETYLMELKIHLKKYKALSIDKILQDYNSAIETFLEKNKSMEEIIVIIGTPYQIAFSHSTLKINNSLHSKYLSLFKRFFVLFFNLLFLLIISSIAITILISIYSFFITLSITSVTLLLTSWLIFGDIKIKIAGVFLAISGILFSIFLFKPIKTITVKSSKKFAKMIADNFNYLFWRFNV